MHCHKVLLALIFLAPAVSLAAQVKTESQPNDSAHAAIDMGKTQTLEGCLAEEPATTASVPNINSPGNPQANTQGNINSPGTPQVASGQTSDTQGLRSGSGTPPPPPPAAAPPKFTLKRQGNGQEVLVEGLPTQLSPHVGHTVQLSGMLTQKNGKDVLTVGVIKHIAASCDAKPGLASDSH